MLEKNLKNLQALLSVMETDHLTKEDFTTHFSQVLDFVKKIAENNRVTLEAIKQSLTLMVDKIKTENGSEMSDIKKETINYCQSEMEKMMKAHDEKMGEVDSKMTEVQNGLDGKDADEEKIVNEVIDKVQTPVLDKLGKSLPTLGIAIRDGLEILNGDDRLDISAIDGLQEALDEAKRGKIGGVGGFNYGAMTLHFADPYTPTGLVNGVNKDFVLSSTPNPASSLKVWCDGQKKQLTTDYTLSGTTISFIDAPLTDTIIEVEHRI